MEKLEFKNIWVGEQFQYQGKTWTKIIGKRAVTLVEGERLVRKFKPSRLVESDKWKDS